MAAPAYAEHSATALTLDVTNYSKLIAKSKLIKAKKGLTRCKECAIVMGGKGGKEMESGFTAQELGELAELRSKLHKAKAHSPEAVAIGKQITKINQQAYLRRRATTPIEPKWMRAFRKQWKL